MYPVHTPIYAYGGEGAELSFWATRRLETATCSSINLKTHGVENRRRFSTPKTDMAEKSDDDAVAAAIMH